MVTTPGKSYSNLGQKSSIVNILKHLVQLAQQEFPTQSDCSYITTLVQNLVASRALLFSSLTVRC